MGKTTYAFGNIAVVEGFKSNLVMVAKGPGDEIVMLRVLSDWGLSPVGSVNLEMVREIVGSLSDQQVRIGLERSGNSGFFEGLMPTESRIRER